MASPPTVPYAVLKHLDDLFNQLGTTHQRIYSWGAWVTDRKQKRLSKEDIGKILDDLAELIQDAKNTAHRALHEAGVYK